MPRKAKPQDAPPSDISPLRIAGRTFAVVALTPPPGLGTTNMGEFDNVRGVISLDASMPDEVQRKTLLHELVHASDRLYGSASMTEDETVTIENGLWAIFNDNPGLARALFGDNA